jgi:hypothetical protein
MGTTTALCESQPLLGNRLPPLTYTQKKALAFTMGTFQLFGGIYGMYHAATDRERTSFNYTQFTTSFLLTFTGSLTNFLCLKGLFPFEFRHPEPVQNIAEVLPPAVAEPQPSVAELDFLNTKLDELLNKCGIAIPNSSSDLKMLIDEKCALLAGYIEAALQAAAQEEPDRAAAVTEVLKSLQALGQLKLTGSSLPPSRAGTRPPSTHNTPAASPSRNGRERDTTPTQRQGPPASAPSSPFKDLEIGGQGSAKKEN